MQISQMFKRKPCVFSIECFPPKQTANFGKMKDTLRTMRTLNPDFISVTYGAGGSTGGVSTVEVAEFLKNDLNVEPLAHMICMGSDKAKAAQLLDQLNAAGVRNVLTLRGDHTPTTPKARTLPTQATWPSLCGRPSRNLISTLPATPKATPKPLPWPRMLPTCALSRRPVPPTC